MTLIKYQPTREAARSAPGFFGEWGGMDRLFEDMVHWPMRGYSGTESAVFSPAVDIHQCGDELLVKAELPGVKSEDIELTIHGDTVTIKGSKKQDVEEGEGKYRYIERRYGEFLRTFSLPTAVDESKAKADFKDGVLEIRLPIAEAAKPKKIAIANGK